MWGLHRCVDLEGQIDLVHGDLAVAEGVGHVGVDLGHDEAAPGPRPLDGGRPGGC